MSIFIPEMSLTVSASGVLVLSWYPPGIADNHGEPCEDLVPAVMDAAHRHSIKVTGERTGMFSHFLVLY